MYEELHRYDYYRLVRYSVQDRTLYKKRLHNYELYISNAVEIDCAIEWINICKSFVSIQQIAHLVINCVTEYSESTTQYDTYIKCNWCNKRTKVNGMQNPSQVEAEYLMIHHPSCKQTKPIDYLSALHLISLQRASQARRDRSLDSLPPSAQLCAFMPNASQEADPCR